MPDTSKPTYSATIDQSSHWPICILIFTDRHDGKGPEWDGSLHDHCLTIDAAIDCVKSLFTEAGQAGGEVTIYEQKPPRVIAVGEPIGGIG